ncbi:hypothetical protein BDZ97DRAFT_1813982 [Flammula alnicola]|nr:hypothetical protein BDZ97DRAFT_1813982 [Flammula alnicola]
MLVRARDGHGCTDDHDGRFVLETVQARCTRRRRIWNTRAACKPVRSAKVLVATREGGGCTGRVGAARTSKKLVLARGRRKKEGADRGDRGSGLGGRAACVREHQVRWCSTSPARGKGDGAREVIAEARVRANAWTGYKSSTSQWPTANPSRSPLNPLKDRRRWRLRRAEIDERRRAWAVGRERSIGINSAVHVSVVSPPPDLVREALHQAVEKYRNGIFHLE